MKIHRNENLQIISFFVASTITLSYYFVAGESLILAPISVISFFLTFCLLYSYQKNKYIGKKVKVEVEYYCDNYYEYVYYQRTNPEYVEATIKEVDFENERAYLVEPDSKGRNHISLDFLILEETKQQKKKGTMPRIYKHALWFALVFIVWRILINFDHIVLYLVSLIERFI